jgi:hypothetical protein
VKGSLWGARRFISVDPGGRRIPSNVIGRLAGPSRDLAVAVNGRIAAVGRSFKAVGGLKLNFSMMVPESAFAHGFNDVRVYEVRDGTLASEVVRSPRA